MKRVARPGTHETIEAIGQTDGLRDRRVDAQLPVVHEVRLAAAAPEERRPGRREDGEHPRR
jgi:hypothetical protein